MGPKGEAAVRDQVLDKMRIFLLPPDTFRDGCYGRICVVCILEEAVNHTRPCIGYGDWKEVIGSFTTRIHKKKHNGAGKKLSHCFDGSHGNELNLDDGV